MRGNACVRENRERARKTLGESSNPDASLTWKKEKGRTGCVAAPQTALQPKGSLTKLWLGTPQAKVIKKSHGSQEQICLSNPSITDWGAPHEKHGLKANLGMNFTAQQLGDPWSIMLPAVGGFQGAVLMVTIRVNCQGSLSGIADFFNWVLQL